MEFEQCGISSTLQLPFRRLVEEFKIARTRKAILYQDLKDPKMTEVGIDVRTGTKWKAAQELNSAEQKSRQKAVVGKVAVGRSSLGYCSNPRRKDERKNWKHYLQYEVTA